MSFQEFQKFSGNNGLTHIDWVTKGLFMSPLKNRYSTRGTLLYSWVTGKREFTKKRLEEGVQSLKPYLQRNKISNIKAQFHIIERFVDLSRVLLNKFRNFLEEFRIIPRRDIYPLLNRRQSAPSKPYVPQLTLESEEVL